MPCPYSAPLLSLTQGKQPANILNFAALFMPIENIGLMQPLDERGHIVNICLQRPIQTEYAPVLDLAQRLLQNSVGEHLHSLYVRGSVGKGTALPHNADLDLIAVWAGSSAPVDWEQKETELSDALQRQFPFLNGVETMDATLQELQKKDYFQFVLKTQSRFLCGKTNLQAELPEFGIGKVAYMHLPFLSEDLEKARQWAAEAGDNTQELCEIGAWIAKRSVRTGFELVMERVGAYTRDLYPCWAHFAEFYPQHSENMRTLLSFAIAPSSERGELEAIIGHTAAFLLPLIAAKATEMTDTAF